MGPGAGGQLLPAPGAGPGVRLRLVLGTKGQRERQGGFPHLPGVHILLFRSEDFGGSDAVLVRLFYGNKIIREIAAPGVCALLIEFPASQLLLSLTVESLAGGG